VLLLLLAMVGLNTVIRRDSDSVTGMGGKKVSGEVMGGTRTVGVTTIVPAVGMLERSSGATLEEDRKMLQKLPLRGDGADQTKG
jgi:hypothetical protein